MFLYVKNNKGAIRSGLSGLPLQLHSILLLTSNRLNCMSFNSQSIHVKIVLSY